MSGSEGEDLNGMGAAAVSPTTGARCGAVQYKEVDSTTENGGKKSRLVVRMENQAGKSVGLFSGDITVSVLDETEDLGVVSCSSPEEGDSWLEKEAAAQQSDLTLEARCQEDGESLKDYYDAMRGWSMIATPKVVGISRGEQGGDAFLSGLKDGVLAEAIRREAPKNLIDAYQQMLVIVAKNEKECSGKVPVNKPEEEEVSTPLTEVSDLSDPFFISCSLDKTEDSDGSSEEEIDTPHVSCTRRVKREMVPNLVDPEGERQARLKYKAAWRDTTEEEKKEFDKLDEGKAKNRTNKDECKIVEKERQEVQKGEWEPLEFYFKRVMEVLKENADPEKRGYLRDKVEVDAFLNGLPEGLAREVRREGPNTVKEAYLKAVKFKVRQLTEGNNYASEVVNSDQTHRIVRPRRDGESLKAYYGVVRRFVRIAYPRNSVVGKDGVGRVLFLEGLQNPELYERTLSFGPATLDEACEVAEYIEETMKYQEATGITREDVIDTGRTDNAEETVRKQGLQRFLDRGKKKVEGEPEGSPAEKSSAMPQYEDTPVGALCRNPNWPVSIGPDVVGEIDKFLLSKWYRPQRAGECVTRYHDEVCRSVAGMYPYRSKVKRGQIGLGVFLEGLVDPELVKNIVKHRPKHIADGCTYACMELATKAREKKEENRLRDSKVSSTEPSRNQAVAKAALGICNRGSATLKKYFDDVQYVLGIAYPGDEEKVRRERIGVDEFLKGLENDGLARRVRRTAPKTVRTAYERAVLLETHRGQFSEETAVAYCQALRQHIGRQYPDKT